IIPTRISSPVTVFQCGESSGSCTAYLSPGPRCAPRPANARRVHTGDWNQHEGIARGNRVILRLKRLETINQEADKTEPAVIAIQCHMGIPWKCRSGRSG